MWFYSMVGHAKTIKGSVGIYPTEYEEKKENTMVLIYFYKRTDISSSLDKSQELTTSPSLDYHCVANCLTQISGGINFTGN